MSTENTQHAITRHLRALRDGDEQAKAAVYSLVYGELRRLARAQIRRRAGGAFRTTELVHEAYLRLGDGGSFENRAHFFAASARAMRHVLIDHFRKSRARKRGGGDRPLELDEGKVAAGERGDTLLALDAALERLEQQSPRLAQVVEYKFFGGMTESEIGAVTGRSARTVRSDWRKAKAWLALELGAPTD